MVAANNNVRQALGKSAIDTICQIEKDFRPQLNRFFKDLQSGTLPQTRDAFDIASAFSGMIEAFRMVGAFDNNHKAASVKESGQ